MAMTEQGISLVSAAKNGDMRAFESLYEMYYGKVFALARTTVKNEADAEDILQQAFISAWRNIGTLTDPAAFNTWIQKITLNLCYSLLRKKNISILLDAENDIENFGEEIPDGDLLPAVYAERDDLRERLGKIIDSLSDVQKQTIVLYYFNEQKVEEIAYVMECNVGTVKSRLFLARNAIRAEVEEQESRSGQKFYGIAGIPMLPIAHLLAQQIEAQTISAAACSSSLSTIMGAISDSAISSAAASAAAAPAAATAPTATAATTAAATTISLTTKIIVGVAAALVGVGGLIGWLATNNSSSETAPENTPVPVAAIIEESTQELNTPDEEPQQDSGDIVGDTEQDAISHEDITDSQEGQSTEEFDFNNIFQPNILDAEPRIEDIWDLYRVNVDYLEFEIMYSLFYSEIGACLLASDPRVSDGDRPAILAWFSESDYINTGMDSRQLEDELYRQVEEVDYIKGINFNRDLTLIQVYRDDTSGLRKATVGLSEIEDVIGSGAMVGFVITLTDGSPLAFVDVTGSHIIWLTSAIERLQ